MSLKLGAHIRDIEEKFAILKGSIYATNTSNIKYFFQLIQKKSLQDFFFFFFFFIFFHRFEEILGLKKHKR